jgi:cobalt-zinc-cadmium efflux system protein
LWAVGVTASILVVEAIGGVVSGSLALLSDAGHMLTDVAALLISLAAMLMAEKPISSKHTYGLARMEVLAALGNTFIFFLMIIGIAWEAIQRFNHPSLPDWKTMGAVALVGLGANALSAWFLRGSHEHDLNVRSAWLHVLGDLASSVGVLVGVVVIAQTGWTWVDPLLSLAIALLIASSAFKLFWKALHILLEAAPKGLTPEKITEILKSEIPAIREVHHIHLWEVGSGGIHLTAHLVVEDGPLSAAQEVAARAERLLEEKYGIVHSTLQLEAPVRIRMHGPDKV